MHVKAPRLLVPLHASLLRTRSAQGKPLGVICLQHRFPSLVSQRHRQAHVVPPVCCFFFVQVNLFISLSRNNKLVKLDMSHVKKGEEEKKDKKKKKTPRKSKKRTPRKEKRIDLEESSGDKETDDTVKGQNGSDREDEGSESIETGIRQDLMDIGKRKLATRPTAETKGTKKEAVAYTVRSSSLPTVPFVCVVHPFVAL